MSFSGSLFNPDQQAYMASLGRMLPSAKCWCGWYRIGLCPHCPPGKTLADRIAASCSECHAGPSVTDTGRVVHQIDCPTRCPPVAFDEPWGIE